MSKIMCDLLGHSKESMQVLFSVDIICTDSS